METRKGKMTGIPMMGGKKKPEIGQRKTMRGVHYVFAKTEGKPRWHTEGELKRLKAEKGLPEEKKDGVQNSGQSAQSVTPPAPDTLNQDINKQIAEEKNDGTINTAPPAETKPGAAPAEPGKEGQQPAPATPAEGKKDPATGEEKVDPIALREEALALQEKALALREKAMKIQEEAVTAEKK